MMTMMMILTTIPTMHCNDDDDGMMTMILHLDEQLCNVTTIPTTMTMAQQNTNHTLKVRGDGHNCQ